MALVNSKTKKLEIAEIIVQSLAREAKAGTLPKGVPVQAAILSITAEMSMDNTEPIQIGNTVFISHFSKDRKEVAMRALNMDVAENYIQNAVEYGDWLQDQGVERFTTDFYGEDIRQLLTAVFKKTVRLNGGGYKIFNLKNGGFRAYAQLGRGEA